jgi:hypothetical protein
MNVEQQPGPLSTWISPPCAFTICLAMARPNPAAEIKNQMNNSWNSANMGEMMELIADMRKISQLVGQEFRNAGPERGYNVMCLGGRVTGRALAWDLVRTFLKGTERFKRRLAQIAELENKEPA